MLLSIILPKTHSNASYVFIVIGDPWSKWLLLGYFIILIFGAKCFAPPDMEGFFKAASKMYIHPSAFSDPEAYVKEFHKKDIRPDGNDISK